MIEGARSGLFLAEGSSDAPLGDLVQALLLARGVNVSLTRPDFDLLEDRVPRDLGSRMIAARTLMRDDVDVVVIHRDADNVGAEARRGEMVAALDRACSGARLIPVIPVRMTEAWLLLDEQAIRRVAGNPSGRVDLALPKTLEVERLADPKAKLRECLLTAADVTGRRRERLDRRFDSNRRQLLERLEPEGPVMQLTSWQALLRDVENVAQRLR